MKRLRWGDMPLWLKILTIVGALALMLLLIPTLLNGPQVYWPAGVFWVSVMALLIYGVSRR